MRDASDVEPSCEGHAHQAWTGQRRTPATMVLVVTMVALYLVEAGLGAPDYVPALVRLGALVRERVLAGEIWRLISCTFLHGSVMHLAFNMVVLWSLGQMLERILGTARFVVMYVAAGIGGSLLSLVFLKGVSVGASGALWGLMTAEMVLIWRARGILPEGLRTKMRLESMWNLGLNVINSFRPGVDWAAHGGGGFMGVAFGSLGILTCGLPGSAEAAEGAPPPPDRVPPFMRAGAWASGMVLVLGLVAAVVGGRPWEAATGPALVRTAIGTTGWTAELPIGLAPRVRARGRVGVRGHADRSGATRHHRDHLSRTADPGAAGIDIRRSREASLAERRFQARCAHGADPGGGPRRARGPLHRTR